MSKNAAATLVKSSTSALLEVDKPLGIHVPTSDSLKTEMLAPTLTSTPAKEPRNLYITEREAVPPSELKETPAGTNERVKVRPKPAKEDESSRPNSKLSVYKYNTKTSNATSCGDSAPEQTLKPHGQAHQRDRPETSTSGSRTIAKMCSDPQHRGQTPFCDLLHRKDFEVKRIRRKLLVNNKVVFVVRWKSTWLPAKLIIHGDDLEYSRVEADGTRWYIKRTLGRREFDGVQQRKVRWMDTQEPQEMLSNAQEAIALFEASLQMAGVDEHAIMRQRKVLTILESKFPHGSVLPQSEEDYATSQRWVASLWPKIRPHRTLDLYPAIYRIHMELAVLKPGRGRCGKSYRCLLKLPQLRPLQWHQDYLDSGKLFACGRRSRASLFIQATGVHDPSCTRCLGERITPFLGCVRSAPDQQLWLNGACANCGTQDNGDCDYHRRGKGHRSKSSFQKVHTAVESRLPLI